MGQITTGIRGVLSHPAVYNSLQTLMGSRRGRRAFVKEFLRPNPHSRVLDIGCGTAEILKFLPEDVEYYGYDISESYIDAARRRFGPRGHFFCADLDHSEIARWPKFDIVLAIGVLHHLDDTRARRLLAIARSALTDGGRAITQDGCYAHGQNPLARALIAADRGQNVRSPEGYKALADSAFSKVEGHLRHRRWIPYTHWIMECSG